VVIQNIKEHLLYGMKFSCRLNDKGNHYRLPHSLQYRVNYGEM